MILECFLTWGTYVDQWKIFFKGQVIPVLPNRPRIWINDVNATGRASNLICDNRSPYRFHFCRPFPGDAELARR